MKENVEKKIDLLLTPLWTSNDIGVYLNRGRTTAFKIKKQVVNMYGCSPYGVNFVNRDDVLKTLGTTAESELKKVKALRDD